MVTYRRVTCNLGTDLSAPQQEPLPRFGARHHQSGSAIRDCVPFSLSLPLARRASGSPFTTGEFLIFFLAETGAGAWLASLALAEVFATLCGLRSGIWEVLRESRRHSQRALPFAATEYGEAAFFAALIQLDTVQLLTTRVGTP